MFDILIKNGLVIDGTGSPAKRLDVAIEKGKIADIGPNINAKATQTVDATDRYVTPGFIDIQNHSDSYWTIFDQPDQLSLLSQGITTIVMGNCGASLAPLLSSESIKTIQKWHSLNGISINWASMAEYLSALAKIKKGVNVATLVGHATLRRGLVADSPLQLKDTELEVMKKTLDDALAAGAMGLSMGLVYAHEVNSTSTELEELTKILKPYNKYLSVHLRSEGQQILESIDEAIDFATKAQVSLKISHLKIRGKKNWHLFDHVLNKLEVAYHQGTNISFDIYPYESAWSVLYTYLPKWAYEGGRAQILQMIAEPASRRKILDFLKDQNQSHEFDSIVISEAAGNKNFIGKSLRQIADNQAVSIEEALINVIAATSAQVVVIDHNLSAEHVELLCFSPLAFISTDGAGYSGRDFKLIHPRCYGTMPRFLRMVRERKTIKWETAIKKLTSEPAQWLGLPNRGELKVGAAADVVIFNPSTVKDTADYKNPDSYSEGMDMVIVNGMLAYSDRQGFKLNGQVLTR